MNDFPCCTDPDCPDASHGPIDATDARGAMEAAEMRSEAIVLAAEVRRLDGAHNEAGPIVHNEPRAWEVAQLHGGTGWADNLELDQETLTEDGDPDKLPSWMQGDIHLNLGTAVEAAARAYANAMGLSLALVSPAAAARLRDEVFAWLNPAVAELVGQVSAALRPRVELWHAAELADVWDAGHTEGEGEAMFDAYAGPGDERTPTPNPYR